MTYDIILGRTTREKEKLGDRGVIKIAKHYVTMGKTTSLANYVVVDVAKPHLILVCGKRGSGKSYTMAVIAESMAKLPEEVKNNLATLFLDTMGIYWTTKYPNYRDADLLSEWGLEPKTLGEDVLIFVPEGFYEDLKGKGVPVDKPFSLNTSDLTSADWCTLLNVSIISPHGVLISRSITKLLEKKKPFGVDDIILGIRGDPKATNEVKEAVVNMFETVKAWGLFSKKGTPITDLIQRGKMSILDVSYYIHQGASFSIRALVIGILARTILRERLFARKLEELATISKGWRYFKKDYEKESKEKVPMVWLFLDEAHEFLPKHEKTLASDALIQVIREGRQPGISLVLATQQPGKIHTDAITQCDIVISHRLTAKIDIEALNNIMHTYLPFALQKYIEELPRTKGAAIVLDDKLERMYPIQIRPRTTWHGGAEPVIVPEKEE